MARGEIDLRVIRVIVNGEDAVSCIATNPVHELLHPGLSFSLHSILFINHCCSVNVSSTDIMEGYTMKNELSNQSRFDDSRYLCKYSPTKV